MENQSTEAWNMAKATLMRFDHILKQCSLYAQQGDLVSWKGALMDLRRNICPFMSDPQFKESDIKFKTLPLKWNFGGRAYSRYFAEVNQILDEVQMSYVRIMKEKNLLMPKTIDAGKAISDM